MNLTSAHLSHLPRIAAACALVMGAVGVAQAQTVKKPPPVAPPSSAVLPATLLDNQWHGAISLGGAMSSGNSSTVLFSGAADATRASVRDKLSFWGITNYATSKSEGVTTTNANSLRLGGRYDYNLTPKVFMFGAGEGETNEVTGLRSRFGADVGAGYHVFSNADTLFDVYAGVGAARVSYTNGETIGGAELLFGETSTHRLSSTTSFKQRLEIRPGGNGLGTLSTFDATLATAISGAWTLNTGLQVRHATEVPAGRKSTDTILTVGFGYKY
jgi:putative salt-induced outer membrane protein